MIVIEIPGAPRGKGRPRFSRRTGVAYTDAKTREYERHLALHASMAMRGREPIEGPVSIDVLAAFPVPVSWPKRKREGAVSGRIKPTIPPDADNALKVIDAFNGIVFLDDAQVVEAKVSKVYAAGLPYLRVTVTRLDGDAAYEPKPREDLDSVVPR